MNTRYKYSRTTIIRIGFRGTKIKYTCTVDCKKIDYTIKSKNTNFPILNTYKSFVSDITILQ
jgi:hypothetical protein